MQSPTDIGALAFGAGVHDITNLANAIAVALAESGGNEKAHNTKPPDDSYGLWQINLYGDLKAQRMTQLGLKAPTDLYDPATNAHAMAVLSNNGASWGPWSTYGSLAYRAFYPGALAIATTTVQAAGTIGAVETAVDTAASAYHGVVAIAKFFGEAVKWLIKAGTWLAKRENWNRIGKVVIGGALVLVGIGTMAGTTIETLQGAPAKYAKAAPKGGSGRSSAPATGGAPA